jgi:hypothetical protein
MVYFMEGVKILIGKGKPLMVFKVESDPPSVYYNFRVKNNKVKELEKYLKLPKGFSLAKMKCLSTDRQPFYCLTLNVYRVSGLTNALRAEWDAYVNDPEGRIRYMVVEARSSQYSMDPVDIITKKFVLEHAFNGKMIETFTTTPSGSIFRASCPAPVKGKHKLVETAKEWIQANDEIYWGNGIIDRAFYNRSMWCTDVYIIPVESVTIEHETQWTPFLEPVPEHVAVFSEAIEFVIGPWWNI